MNITEHYRTQSTVTRQTDVICVIKLSVFQLLKHLSWHKTKTKWSLMQIRMALSDMPDQSAF